MKKILSFILVLAALAVLLTACETSIPSDYYGKGDETKEAKATKKSDETKAAKPKETEKPDINKEPSDITPLLWRVTSPDGQSIYVFGSIHVGDDGIYPLPDYIMDAFNKSEYLAVEADIIAFEEDTDALMEMSEMLMYPIGQTVTDDIDAELIEQLREIIADSDSEFSEYTDFLGMFVPYMRIDIMNSVALEKSGLDSDKGLDRFFLKQAAEDDKEILEIEDALSQIEMMLNFSAELIELQLEAMLDIDTAADDIKRLYEVWQSGDETRVLELLEEEPDLSDKDDAYIEKYNRLNEEYNNAMLVERNINMAEAAKSYMDDDMSVFYVVGLAHLVGEGSVIELLVQNGYTVEKLNG